MALGGVGSAIMVRRSFFIGTHGSSAMLTHILILACLLTNTAQTSSTDTKSSDKKSRKLSEFERQLRHIKPSFQGGPFNEWHTEYLAAIQDKKKWAAAVSRARDTTTRTSRAGEVLAFSGQYQVEVVPVGKHRFPKTTKGHCRVFVFRPVAKFNNGKWLKLPPAIRDRSYLIVRGDVPHRHDPYDIVACTYLGDMTAQQIESLVKESLKF